MKNYKKNRKENYWISLSDMMTGLMVIFMFIAISYVNQIKAQQDDKNKIIEEFKNTKIALYQELQQEFRKDFESNHWNAVIDNDLSIRFLNERVFFAYDRDNLNPVFKDILRDFFPRYINILLKPQYRNKIAEVRIEGHTDSSGEYMYNVNLSQRRTANVLDFLLNKGNNAVFNMPVKDQQLIKFWFTANGFSSGRTLDNDGAFTLQTGHSENSQKSRRVEFRIVTKTNELVEVLAKQLETKY